MLNKFNLYKDDMIIIISIIIIILIIVITIIIVINIIIIIIIIINIVIIIIIIIQWNDSELLNYIYPFPNNFFMHWCRHLICLYDSIAFVSHLSTNYVILRFVFVDLNHILMNEVWKKLYDLFTINPSL